MRLFFKLLFIAVIILPESYAQNLLDERIRRLPARKKSIYLESGIFHNGGLKHKSSLKSVRHHYSTQNGYERVVFDFATKKVPRVYGYISTNDRKLYLDLFDTQLLSNFGSFGKNKFVKSVNFFPIQKDSLSVEIVFKKNVSLDVFYLESPGRLVVDIR